jgi:hypothetical protein
MQVQILPEPFWWRQQIGVDVHEINFVDIPQNVAIDALSHGL